MLPNGETRSNRSTITFIEVSGQQLADSTPLKKPPSDINLVIFYGERSRKLEGDLGAPII